MALFFGKKKDDGPQDNTPPGGGTPNGGGGAGDPPSFSPEKAKRFFEHAKTVDATDNYEYALQSWLSGMKLDPMSKEGIEGFFGSMAKFLGSSGGKKGVGKEVQGVLSGKSDLDRYLNSLLEWGQKPTEQSLAVRAMELAARLNLSDPVKWIGERAFAIVVRNPKPRKDLIVKVSEAFEKVQSFDLAVRSAEAAYQLDKSDGELAGRIRNLAAQATMNRGGYERPGEAGGYRQNIRDADKQKQLDAADRITKTAETIETILAAAQKDYESRPHDMYAVEKYAKILLERGEPQDEETAHGLLMKAAEEHKQFRFRELAGEIRLRQLRRKSSEAKKALDASPGNPALQTALQTALEAQGLLEVAEYEMRVEAYPTDLVKKFELGKRYFHVGRLEEAIGMLQLSQSEPRYRAQSLSLLGQAFLKLDWANEAVDTFRSALDVRDMLPDVQLDLQYYLMCALQAKGESERHLQSAEESEKLASSIAIKNIMYRDIRMRREAIKKLLISLRGGTPS